MKKALQIIIIVIVSVYAGMLINDSLTAATPVAPSQAELLRLVNEERAKVGVAPLTRDAEIESNAQRKATDMDLRGYFSHEDPDTGEITSTPAKCIYGSENIVELFEDAYYAENAIQWWVNSEPHYKAMIDPRYTLTGFGISGTKIVQHFCQAMK